MTDLEKLIKKKNKEKIIFTAGPASLIKENVSNLNPCFGRGDIEYLKKEKIVLEKILKLCGQEKIAR